MFRILSTELTYNQAVADRLAFSISLEDRPILYDLAVIYHLLAARCNTRLSVELHVLNVADSHNISESPVKSDENHRV